MYVALCTKLGSGHTFITSYDDIQALIRWLMMML